MFVASSSMRSTIADQLLAGLGQPEQPLAAAHEQLDAELVLEILDVLADARLRGVERVGDLGQVEVAPDGLANDAKLLEVHGSAPAFPLEDAQPRADEDATGWPAARSSSASFSADNLHLEVLRLAVFPSH